MGGLGDCFIVMTQRLGAAGADNPKRRNGGIVCYLDVLANDKETSRGFVSIWWIAADGQQ